MDTVNVVLVTNVGQGFGRAVALSYGQANHDVVCADRDVDLASKTAAEIEELGGQAIPIQADMTTQMDVYNAFNKVFEIFGNLSGVVHVASYESLTPFRDLAESEFSELVQENLKSTYLTLRTAARLLERGWLVVVTPPASADEPQMLAVTGAITDMTAGFGARHRNLRVNIVTPSRSASDPRHDARLVRAVRYLGSEAAAGISGHRTFVELVPPPKVVESLLPEVRAALDETVRQDDLEEAILDNGSDGADGDGADDDGADGDSISLFGDELVEGDDHAFDADLDAGFGVGFDDDTDVDGTDVDDTDADDTDVDDTDADDFGDADADRLADEEDDYASEIARAARNASGGAGVVGRNVELGRLLREPQIVRPPRADDATRMPRSAPGGQDDPSSDDEGTSD